jgi:hypothetical protein
MGGSRSVLRRLFLVIYQLPLLLPFHRSYMSLLSSGFPLLYHLYVSLFLEIVAGELSG